MRQLDPAQKRPQTLAEIWHEHSIAAPSATVRQAIVTGVVAVAGILLDNGRWSYSMVYLIAGCFGARALLTGRGRSAARVRVMLDLLAVGATAIVVLQALHWLLGGTVGLIRA
jgi:hypothetical protein